MKRIVVTGAGINNGNRGCAALALSAFHILSIVEKKSAHKWEYISFNSATEPKKTIKIGESSIELQQFEGGTLFSFFVGAIRTKLKSVWKLATSDVVFHICGGDSYSDIYGIPRFKGLWLWIEFTALLNLKLKKRIVFLPQTIGPFKNTGAKNFAIRQLENAAHVFVRDNASNRYLLDNSTRAITTETIDMAFFLPYRKKTFNSNFTHIGINISALLWNGGYTGKNEFGLKLDYKKIVFDIIEFFVQIPDTQVHLISHDLDLNRSLGNDYEVAVEICEKFESNHNVILAPFFLDAIDAKSYISGMSFFVGSRMHATIAAFSAGVPVIPMAYSRKFTGLFNETLQYKYCIDMTNSKEDIVIAVIQSAFNEREKIQSLIQEKNAGIIKERFQLLLTQLEQILQ